MDFSRNGTEETHHGIHSQQGSIGERSVCPCKMYDYIEIEKVEKKKTQTLTLVSSQLVQYTILVYKNSTIKRGIN